MNDKELLNIYKTCIINGVDLNYGKVSFCDLRNYRHSNVKTDRRYQVHSEDRKYPFSYIFYDLNEAAYQFVQMCKKVNRLQ